MPRRDPNLLTGYLCRFCGERITWGEIVRLLVTHPGQAAFMEIEEYAHLACLAAALRPGLALTFPEHWSGKADTPRLYALAAAEAEASPCAICAHPLDPAQATTLRAQRPAGTVKRPEFDEQPLAVHGDCWEERPPAGGPRQGNGF